MKFLRIKYNQTKEFKGLLFSLYNFWNYKEIYRNDINYEIIGFFTGLK